MPIFLLLQIDYSMYQAYKVNQYVPSPGSSSKTKLSTQVNRNRIQISDHLKEQLIDIKKHKQALKSDSMHSKSKDNILKSMKTVTIDASMIKSLLQK